MQARRRFRSRRDPGHEVAGEAPGALLVSDYHSGARRNGAMHAERRTQGRPAVRARDALLANLETRVAKDGRRLRSARRPAFPRDEDKLLTRFRLTPADASGESDHPDTTTGATATPRSEQSHRARRDECIAGTMRKPDRAKLPAAAALLLSSRVRLLVRHASSCLAGRGGRLVRSG